MAVVNAASFTFKQQEIQWESQTPKIKMLFVGREYRTYGPDLLCRNIVAVYTTMSIPQTNLVTEETPLHQ